MKISRMLCMTCLIAALSSLGFAAEATEYRFTDALGVEVALEDTPERVVALLGSYGDVWAQAGGTLVGATEDAVVESGLNLEGDIAIVGSNKTPNIELILALNPDFAILSADTSRHVEARATLEAAGIPCGYFSVMTYMDYMDLLKTFTEITGRDDLYLNQVETVQKPIEAAIANAQEQPDYEKHTALLLRAYATSVKAKDSVSTIAGPILKDMGLVNIADGETNLMENLTMESIIALDPEYIFVVFMGLDKEAAERTLQDTLLANPAWATLSAVQNGKYVVLDHQLFHYRPNARWMEAYAFIEDLIYGA